MSYRGFAIITLIAAPIIAVMAQNFVQPTPTMLPPSSSDASQASGAPQPYVPPPTPAVVEPSPPPMAGPVGDPAAFAQPLAGAGQPTLAPGQGLPGDAQAPLVQQEPQPGAGIARQPATPAEPQSQ